MAELNPRDRLQPFLLDRLTDDQSDQAKESRDKHVFSPRQMKTALLRDMAWLLNTPAPIESDGITEFPNVAASVLNYGIPDLTGLTASSISGGSLEKSLLRALQTFEPRLDRKSLGVRLSNDDSDAPNTVAMEIRGEIIANQLVDPLFVKTEIDLETGQFALRDRPNG